MIAALVSLILLVCAEIVAQRLEQFSIRATAVSSLRDTDFELGQLGRIVRISAVAIAALLMIAGAVLGGAWACTAILTVFLIARSGLARMFKASAAASIDARLAQALQRPEFAQARMTFHFSAPDLREPTHVDMWMAPINSIGRPWFVILRERAHLKFFGQDDRPHAVMITKKEQLGLVQPQGACLVFYANNAQKNRDMIAAVPSAQHIQLLHGDSDKPPSYSPLTKNYDLVFVAGQMAIDRYAANGVHIPADRFRIVGRPQVAEIDTSGAAEPVQNVGYMPTWRGFYEDTEFSSLDRAAAIINAIQDTLPQATPVFKPHPMSFKDPDWRAFERDINARLSKRGRTASADETPFDIYNASDILITDISSVMIDYLYSGKPLLVVLPKAFDPSEAWRFPSLAAAYLIDADLKNLGDMITLAATDDPKRAAREEIRRQAFGDFDRPPGEAFREVCLQLLAQAPEQ